MTYHRWLVLTLVMFLSLFSFNSNAFAANAKNAAPIKNSKKVEQSKTYPGTASLSSKADNKTKKSKKSSATSSSSVSAKKKKTTKKVSSNNSSRIKGSKVSKSRNKKNIDSYSVWLNDATVGTQVGKASWYGGSFHGGPTASGFSYDMHTFTAAHRTLPLGTVVKVTSDSGKSVMVCINDRGPFVKGRVIDLSYAAARQLGFGNSGVMPVQIEVISDTQGKPLSEDVAFYVNLFEDNNDKKGQVLGPFKQFADATVMHELLSGDHPEAIIELGPLVSESGSYKQY